MSDFSQCVALELKRTFQTNYDTFYPKMLFWRFRGHEGEIDISCEIFLNMSLWSRNARFRLTIIFAPRISYFEALGSDNVEIHIRSEILLNMSLSSLNGRFGQTMRCSTRESYFEAIRSHKVEIVSYCKIFLYVSLSSWNARFGLTWYLLPEKVTLKRFAVKR